MRLAVRDWSACAPGVTGRDAWNKWAKQPVTDFEGLLETPLIPKKNQRRMSSLTKMAIETAQQLSNTESDYLIFASQHGEISRSTKLLVEMREHQEMSPIGFSQSVHNTASGLYTILRGIHTPVNSISAGRNTFYSALIDAYAFIHENPNKQVMLVQFDEVPPHIYTPYLKQSEANFAIGLLLAAETGTEGFECSPEICSGGLPQGLNFLKRLLDV